MTKSNKASEPDEGELMSFPCELDIKVFSKTEVNLEERIQSMLMVNLPEEQILGITAKFSNKGKYRSLSCKIIANSKDQIDLVYADLGKYPEVIMLL